MVRSDSLLEQEEIRTGGLAFKKHERDRRFAATRCWSSGDSNRRSHPTRSLVCGRVMRFVCQRKLRDELRAFGLATPAHEPRALSIFGDRFVTSCRPQVLCDVPRRSHQDFAYGVICPSEAQAPSSSQTGRALSPTGHSPRGQAGPPCRGNRCRVIILGRQGATEVANAEPEFRFCPP